MARADEILLITVHNRRAWVSRRVGRAVNVDDVFPASWRSGVSARAAAVRVLGVAWFVEFLSLEIERRQAAFLAEDFWEGVTA